MRVTVCVCVCVPVVSSICAYAGRDTHIHIHTTVMIFITRTGSTQTCSRRLPFRPLTGLTNCVCICAAYLLSTFVSVNFLCAAPDNARLYVSGGSVCVFNQMLKNAFSERDEAAYRLLV